MSEFQLRKDSYTTTRLIDTDLTTAALHDDEVLVKVDKFGLSANNVTYAVVGDQFGYWQFFPPHTSQTQQDVDGWGVLPVWGFADVVQSNNSDVPVGERIFGYFPPATHLVLRPSNVAEAYWIDSSQHRQKLPPAYNMYRRVEAEPDYKKEDEDNRMLLFPLHLTSFTIYDFFSSNNWFGAKQIVLVSASSKTSTGLAYGIQNDKDAPFQIGLTSTNNVETVKGFNAYDQVIDYDNLNTIDNSKPTAIVDMSGNKALLGRLHKHLGDNMVFCSNVGFTHWTQGGKDSDIIQQRSELFFAPSVIQKRLKEWGGQEFNKRTMAYVAHSYRRSSEWLQMTQLQGLPQMQEIFVDVCDGKIAPEKGLIIQL